MSNLLSRKISELTQDDIDGLSKPIGIKGRPYPMRKRVTTKHSNGSESIAYRIALLEEEENPLTVYSDHNYGFVLGQAMRNMPTPSMLPLFFDAINRRKIGNKRSIQFLKGAAGAGKTYMSEFTGKMRDPRGPIKIDCGQKNLAELLYETVLDFNQDKKFYSELDKRLASGNVNPLSIQLLKDNLGSAALEKDGTLKISWDKIGYGNLIDPESEDGTPLPSEQAVSKALNALREVSRLEGLDNIGGNALGMATQEGPLITAWRDGREIILDEFNRGKKGSTSSLHGVLQFFAGEIDEITVENTLKEKGDNENAQKFVFRRSDQRAGFFVTLTGNAEEDGDDVDELPQSVSSRIMPQTVPLATEEDWQHRICQIMTGIPVSTIYYSKPDQWDNNPELFRKKLKEWRMMGMTDEQIADIPPLQMRLLDRWEDVMEASRKLARFYYTWAELTNPDSPIFEGGNNSNILLELTDTFFRETTIDFRKIVAHIGEAMEARPQTVLPEESSGYEEGPSDQPPAPVRKTDDHDPSRFFGTNLRDVIEKEVIATSLDLGKNALFRQLEQNMRDSGLKAPVLREGKPNVRHDIPALLNEDPYIRRDLRVQAGLIRDLVCNLWRKQNPDTDSVANDHLLTVQNTKRSIEKLIADYEEEEGEPPADPSTALAEALATAKQEAGEGQEASDAQKPQPRFLFVMNGDKESFSMRPFDKALLKDSASSIGFTPEQGGPDAKELIKLDDMLVALTLPRLRDASLRMLWSAEITDGELITGNLNGIKDESLALAEGTSDTGLKISSFAAKANDSEAETTLHMVFNAKSGKSVLVGDSPTISLKDHFKACGMAYIDRCDETAHTALKNALAGLLADHKDAEALEKTLRNAFLLRNTAPSVEHKEDASLADVMLAKDSTCVLPQYVVKHAKP